MTRKRRRRWSPQEKQRLVTEARDRRRRGEGWGAISEALGVGASTLHRWMRGCPSEIGEPAIQPVRVVADAVSLRRSEKEVGLSVVTPDGFRIEGVDLEAALWLWRGLR